MIRAQRPLFEHQERLTDSLRILNDHREEITRFYDSILRVQVQADGIQLLKQAFRASVNERRGASFRRGKVAVEAFDVMVARTAHDVDEAIANGRPEEAHRISFEWLASLPNIEQKIAAMFLKFVVVYLGHWPELLPYLYVPVDGVVLKILKRKLRVYLGPWTQAPTVANPQGKLYLRGGRMSAQYSDFVNFQNQLGQIASAAGAPRILVDELWFTGHIFCKPYPICDRCWLRDICQGRPFV